MDSEFGAGDLLCPIMQRVQDYFFKHSQSKLQDLD